MLTDTALRNLKPNSLIYKNNIQDGMYVMVALAGTVTFRYDYRLNGRLDRYFRAEGWFTISHGSTGVAQGFGESAHAAPDARGLEPLQDGGRLVSLALAQQQQTKPSDCMTMNPFLNEYEQPVGQPMPGWRSRAHPQRKPMDGQYCNLQALEPLHARELFDAYGAAADGRDWTYMAMGPFSELSAFQQYVEKAAASDDPLHYAVIDHRTGRAVGTLALMRIDSANGVIEVGNVMFSPLLMRTPISTEAQYLLMKYVFDGLGYRRYEWKCDSFNAPSRKTAQRLGFQFEGIFRQAMLYKGRSRDTAWFSIIDSEWPAVRSAFDDWLNPANFDSTGLQRRSLADLRSFAQT